MRVMLFDTETDGLIINPESQTQPRICEVFCLMLEQKGSGAEAEFSVLDSYHTLVNPERVMSDEVVAIHHITNAMVAHEPTFKQVAPFIARFVNKAHRVVAHFAMFDKLMIDLEFRRVGYKDELKWPEIFCTVEQTEHWFQHRLPLGTNKRGKPGLYQVLFDNESFSDAHRAKADVLALERCYQRCEQIGWNYESLHEPTPQPVKREEAQMTLPFQ